MIIDLTKECIDLTESIDLSNTEIVSGDGGDDCSICYLKLSTSETITLQCGHIFHAECIRKWSKKKKNCPLDRKSFKLSEVGLSEVDISEVDMGCLLYTSPSPRDLSTSRMPSSA